MPSSGPVRYEEWRKWLLVWAATFLAFETLTGLAILFVPFSVPTQVTVLVHTLVGLVLLVPYAIYQIRHSRVYRDARWTHVKLTGWLSLAATLTAIVSGLVLTVESVLGPRISYAWDTTHIVATVAVLAAVLPHVIALLIRNTVGATPLAVSVRSSERWMGVRTGVLTVVLAVPIVGLALAYHPTKLNNQLPADYSFLYGKDRPFAPSLAQTKTGNAYDARSMAESRNCGTSGCHEEIVKEWQVSAHRYSALDIGFRAVQAAMGAQNGPESTRYCAGCHDPVSLFAGTKNLFQDSLTNKQGLDDGVSCIICHSVEKTDVQGNANYVVHQPPRYMYELRPDGARRLVRDFLIRAYPREHVASLSKVLFKSPEYCAACHKQFVDKEINHVGWVQLQNQYDNWRKSRWNHPGDARRTIECRECHMPLVSSFDPASGDAADYNRTPDDGKHRSHRFLGANQFMPKALNLPGADEQVALVQKWLRGEIQIPEIADKWRNGTAVPLQLSVPEHARPGQRIEILTHILNNKAGHDFPTGPLDIIQAWVEIEVRDQNGKLVYTSGEQDKEHFIQPGSFMFKVEPVDRYGNLIDKHNLWEMVGVRYKRAMFPGFSDEATFSFACPSEIVGAKARQPSAGGVDESARVRVPQAATGELHVRARLLYRKFDQSILNFLAGGKSPITAPVTELSVDSAVIQVGS
jgi:hypothetical protein